MLKRHWIVAGLFLLAPTAFAQEGSNAFGVLGGFTTQEKAVVQVGAGLPGLHLKFLYGVLSRLDVGGIVEVNGPEFVPVDVALRIQTAARFSLLDTGKLGLTVGFSPGIRLDFAKSGPSLGSTGGSTEVLVEVVLPIDLTLGARIASDWIAVAGLDIPLEFNTKGTFNMMIPLMGAVGLEYSASSVVKLWLRYRHGYAFATSGGGKEVNSVHVGAAFGF